MNLIHLMITAILLVLAAFALPYAINQLREKSWITTENNYDAGTETQGAGIRVVVEAAFATRHLLCTQGVAANGAIVCSKNTLPIGPIDNILDSGEAGTARRLAAAGDTIKLVASGAIAANARVYTDDNGKVQTEPTVAGTYYLVGRARIAAAADGDIIEAEPCMPQKLVVVAAFTDVASVGAAFASPALVKVLA